MNLAPIRTGHLPRFASIEDLIKKQKPVEPFYALHPENSRSQRGAFSTRFPATRSTRSRPILRRMC